MTFGCRVLSIHQCLSIRLLTSWVSSTHSSCMCRIPVWMLALTALTITCVLECNGHPSALWITQPKMPRAWIPQISETRRMEHSLDKQFIWDLLYHIQPQSLGQSFLLYTFSTEESGVFTCNESDLYIWGWGGVLFAGEVHLRVWTQWLFLN